MGKSRGFAGRVYQEGENAEALNHTLELAKLPMIDTRDPKELRERIEKFFEICAKNDKRPTIAGLAMAIGISRNTLFAWKEGRVRLTPEIMGIIDRACAIINADMEELVISGTGNVVGEIFLMKNSFEGYTDTREVVHKAVVPQLTAEELSQKAKLLPGFGD